MNRPPFTSSPPSQPSPYRYLGRGGSERPVKLQLIIALVAGLILVAVPLYLWRRPRPESIPTADAAVVDGGAPVLAGTVVAFDAGVSSISLSPFTTVRCENPGPGKTPPERCDHVTNFEDALSRAMRESAPCAPASKAPFTVSFVLESDFRRKKLPALRRQVEHHQAREGAGAAPLRQARHAQPGLERHPAPVRPVQGQRRRYLPVQRQPSDEARGARSRHCRRARQPPPSRSPRPRGPTSPSRPTSGGTPTRPTSAPPSTRACARSAGVVEPSPGGQGPRGHRGDHARRLREARSAPLVPHAHRQFLPRDHAALRHRARGAPRARRALEPGARRRDRAQPAGAAPALARPHRRAPRQRARPRAPPRHHQGRVEPPPQLQLHLRERAPPVPPAPAQRGEPDRLPAGSLRQLHPRPRDVLRGRLVRHPAPRRQPHRGDGVGERHPQPDLGQGRGIVRLAHLRAAALLHPRRVGVGRRPGLELLDRSPLPRRRVHRVRPRNRGRARPSAPASRRTARGAAATGTTRSTAPTTSRARGERPTSTTCRSASRPTATSTPRSISPIFTPAQRAAFASTLLPVSDTQIGPYLQFHDYSSRFIDVHDFETLALIENFRRGHEIILQRPALHAPRSAPPASFVDLFAAVAYTVPFGDGLVRGLVQTDTEISTTASPPTAQGRYPDATVEAALRVVTPRFGVGRLVFDTHLLDRVHELPQHAHLARRRLAPARLPGRRLHRHQTSSRPTSSTARAPSRSSPSTSRGRPSST